MSFLSFLPFTTFYLFFPKRNNDSNKNDRNFTYGLLRR